jgi:hypothetical protein
MHDRMEGRLAEGTQATADDAVRLSWASSCARGGCALGGEQRRDNYAS